MTHDVIRYGMSLGAGVTNKGSYKQSNFN